jgi:protein translocase SecG subunit
VTPTFDLPLGAVIDVIRGLVFVLFVISAVLVTLVVLMQEGKGGGLAGAFGGAGADAFGVKAGTVNRFTAYLASAFLGLALLHAGLSSSGSRLPAPAKPGDSGPVDLPGDDDGPRTPPVPPADGAPVVPPGGEPVVPPGGAPPAEPPPGAPPAPPPGPGAPPAPPDKPPGNGQ